MPNTTVRAAAEGLPNINRRNALVITGTGLAALAATTINAPAASALSPLVDEYKAARIAYEAAEAKLLQMITEGVADAGLKEAEELTETAFERAASAFDALLAAPCPTLADVQTKATVFLSARPAFGGDLEYAEARTLLLSFLPLEA